MTNEGKESLRARTRKKTMSALLSLLYQYDRDAAAILRGNSGRQEQMARKQPVADTPLSLPI